MGWRLAAIVCALAPSLAFIPPQAAQAQADTTAPRVASIGRQTPSGSPTNADSLTWRVTFSESVTGVGASDFSVAGTTATLAASAATGVSNAYDVTASGGNLASLDATVTLSFASGQDIEDSAGNALANTTPTGTNNNSYVVDNTVPSFSSAAADGTSLVITFNEALAAASGLANTAFTVKKTPSGGSEADVALSASVAPSISGRTVTLTLAAALVASDGGVKVTYAKPTSGSNNRLEDAAGNEVASFNEQPVTNNTAGVPGAPGALNADSSNARVRLSWTAAAANGAAVSRYEYRYAEGSSVASSVSWTAVADGADAGSEQGDETGVTVTGLTNGTAYAFEVRAVNSVGNGAAATASATPSNTLPTGSNKTITINEDASYALAANDFGFVDADAHDSLASVKITGLLSAGVGALTLNGTAVVLNQSVTSANIGADLLVYTPAANASGSNYASFKFKVSDGTGESAAEYTITFNVTAVNDPATGVPAVTGNTWVGQTLTAGLGTMADVEGLPVESAFTWQWVRDDGTDQTAISSATSNTYTLVSADQGKAIRVRASFSDGAGNSEGPLVSAATANIRAQPTLTVSVGTANVAENAGASTITVGTGSGPTFPTSQSITLTLGGTASETADFTIGSKTLTLPANTASVATTLTAVQDKIDEPNETVTITASGGGATSSAVTVTITDDDAAPSLTVSVSPESVAENAGESTITIATGTGSTFVDDQTITITLDGTATETDDYTIASKSLTLPKGSGSSESKITTKITAVQDKIDEPDETVGVTAQIGSNTVGSKQTVTITDDDAAPVLSLSVSETAVAENGGTSTITVSTGAGSTFASDQTITIELGGTATETDDFTIASKSLTLPKGSGAGKSEITTVLTGVNDDFYEGVTSENVTVTGKIGANAFGAVRTITITDDELAPKLTLNLSPNSISENGGSSTVTASVSPRTVDAFTLTFTLTPTAPASASDYTLTGSLAFGALAANSTGTLTLTANNNRVDRPDKTVSVNASASESYFRPTDAVTLTITDDDATPAPVLQVSALSVDEDGGEAVVTVTTGTGSTFAASQTVTLTLSGDAQETGDYAIASKSLTLPAGSGLAVSSVTTTLEAVDDIIDEVGEEVRIDAAIGATAVGARQTVTITDDDAAPTLSAALSNSAIAEKGGLSRLTVTTDTGSSTFASDQTITVTLSGTAGEDEDYEITSKSLTLPAGVGSQHSTVTATLTGLDDLIDETAQETVLIDVARVTGATTSETIGAQRTLSVNDDDAAPSLEFKASATQIGEKGGRSTLTVGTGTGSTFETDQTITLTVADVTAVSGSDYEVANTTLTLPAGEGLAESTVSTTATGLDDSNFEGAADQTFTVAAAHGTTAIGSTITIGVRDDEAPSKPVLVLTPSTISESSTRNSGQSQVTATVSPPAEVEFWLKVFVKGPSGRFAALLPYHDSSGTDRAGYIKFDAGQTAGDSGGSNKDFFRLHGVDDEVAREDVEVVLRAEVLGFDSEDFIDLPNPLPGILVPDPVRLTIEDDDSADTTVTLSVDSASIGEGDAAKAITVTGTLSGETPTGDISVTVSVDSGTGSSGALAGTDFAEVSDFTLTIDAGDTTGTASFTLTPTDDSIDEVTETLRVTGVSDSSSVGVAAASISITDNDAAPAPVLSVDQTSIAENGGTATVTVSTGSGSTYSTAQTVTLTLTGTATRGSDYTAGSVQLELPAGSGTAASSVTTTLTAVDDSASDADETIIVAGSIGGSSFGTAQTVTITDDEGTPTVTLVLTPASIFEGGSSAVSASVSPVSAAAFDVTVSAAAVSPATSADFTLTGDTLSFAAGASRSTGSVTLAATDDSAAGGNKTVRVSGSVTATGVTAPADSDLVIRDNDSAVTLALNVSADSVDEDGGAVTVTVTTGTGSTFAADQQITLLIGGTATSGSDYSLGDTTLTLAAGSSSVTTTLTATADDLFEGAETVTLSGQHDGIGFGVERTVTIADAEPAPTVALALSPASIDEDGGTSEVSATLSGATGFPVTLDVSAAPVAPATAADFSLTGSRLSFAAGETASTGTVRVTATDNTVDAADRQVRVSASVSSSLLTDPAAALLTIEDDDEASNSAAITVDTQTVSEGGAAVEVTVTATLSAGARQSVSELTISVLGGGGDDGATSGTDFEAVDDFTLTIPQLQTSGTATFTLTPLQDNISEGSETLTVNATSAAAALGVSGTPTITITDDESLPALEISLSGSSMSESGGSLTVSVTTGAGSTFESDQAVTLSFSGAAAEGEDYSAGATSLTLAAGVGNAASTATTTLSAIGDIIDEPDETLAVAVLLNGAQAASTEASILDDDAPPALVLSVSPETILESGGAAEVTVSTGAGSTFAAAQTITLGLAGTAEQDEDYSISATSLTLPAGSGNSASEVTATVSAIQDELAEQDETVEITASIGDTVVGEVAEITIADDEGETRVLLDLSETTVSERGGTATLRALVSPPADEYFEVEVMISLNDPAGNPGGTGGIFGAASTGSRPADSNAGSVEFETDGTVLRVPAGARESENRITITVIDNFTDSADALLNISGTITSENVNIAPPPPIKLTVEDDDEPQAVALTLSVDPPEIAEAGGVASVTAVSSGPAPSAFDLEVSVTGADSGAYTLSGGTLSFAEGATESSGTVTVTAVDNDVDAADAVLTVSGAVTASGVEAPADVSLTIVDDDEAQAVVLTLSVDPPEIAEAGGVASVTAVSSGPAPSAFDLEVSVTGADSGVYTLSGGTLSFAEGATESSGTVTVTAVDNDVDAADAVLTVSGAVTASGVEAPADVSLTIVDDDEAGAVVLTLSVEPPEIAEAGGVASVTAVSSGPAPSAFDLEVSVTGADSGAYTLSGGTLSFAEGATESSGTVTVTAVDNDVDAADAVLTVSGAVTASGVEAPADVSLTIVDDDEAQAVVVTLSVDPPEIAEAGGVASVTAVSSGPAPSAFDLEVSVTGADSGAYTLSGGTLSFAEGATESSGTVTVTAVDNDVDAADAVLTVSGAVTASGVEAPADVSLTIVDDDEAPGLPGIDVADARAAESDGELVFAVTLTHPAAVPLTLTFATEDGSARAGQDYLAASGSIVVPAGSLSAEIRVSLLADVLAEPDKTLTLIVRSGPILARATGVVTDGDSAAAARWLSRVGLLAGEHVLRAVERQSFEPTIARGASLGGRSFDKSDFESINSLASLTAELLGAGGLAEPGDVSRSGHSSSGFDGFSARRGAYDEARLFGSSLDGFHASQAPLSSADTFGAAPRMPDLSRLLDGASFRLGLGSAAGAPGADGGGISLWGQGAYTSFEDVQGSGIATDGSVATATVGADYMFQSAKIGLAVSHSRIDGAYAPAAGDGGALNAALTGFYPYARLNVGGRVSVWALAGQGRGEMSVESDTASGEVSSDIDTRTAAIGGRGELYSSERGFTLAVKTDALVTRTRAEETAESLASEGDASRFRLGFEASHGTELKHYGMLRTRLAVGARGEAGDAGDSMGLEVEAGAELIGFTPGLTLNLGGHALLAREDGDYEEWGATAGLHYDPSPGSRLGPQVSLTHSLGIGAGGALVGNPWSEAPLSIPGVPMAAQGQGHAEAEFSYGLSQFGGVGTPWLKYRGPLDYALGYGLATRRGMPYVKFRKTREGADVRLGVRLTPACRYDVALEFSSAPARYEGLVVQDLGVALRIRSLLPGSAGKADCEPNADMRSRAGAAMP